MKILCLFVRHGTRSYADALPVLDAWYERHGLLAQRTLWIIDNALDPKSPAQALGSATSLRPGDNRAWEFSAWDRALREAAAERIEYDVVHFVTSAFNTLYTAYLDHFDADMLRYIVARQACLGHIDGYEQPVELAGNSTQFWIRTCFFFLPANIAAQVSPWAAFTDPTRIFSSAVSTEFRSDAPLSRDYQHRIRNWLEGREVGGHTWHSPIGTDAAETWRFQLKTLAILNEHSLSVTMGKRSISSVDFCWLHSLGKAALLADAVPPLVRDQLRVRRRVLGIAEPPG